MFSFLVRIPRKNFHKESDIDVAIVVDNLKDEYSSLLELMRFRREFDLRIEPHLFTKNDFNIYNPLAGEIMRTGLKIK